MVAEGCGLSENWAGNGVAQVHEPSFDNALVVVDVGSLPSYKWLSSFE